MLAGSWFSVCFEEHTECIGIIMGPRSGFVFWDKPCIQWFNISNAIAAARMPFYFTHLAYHSMAISVLAYRAQIKFLPDNLAKRERSVIQRLMHLPGSAFQTDTPFLFDFLGILFKSICVWGAAILFGFALKTVPEWISRWQWAKDHGDAHAPNS